MQNLINTFLEEAEDLISNLEEALLKLEGNPEDKEAINGVFRVMHTLKGSGAMFGFENISNFTHKLETLYDKIRSGNTALSTEIFNVTLKSVDHIKALLHNKDSQDASLQELGDNLTQKITSFLSDDSKTPNAVPEIIEDKNTNLTSYFIEFKPNSDIMTNGTNPLYLIDELNGLGRLEVYISTDAVPSFDLLKPQNCYVAWNFILVSEVDIDEVFDVFIFVDDSADIKIEKICDYDFMSIPAGVEYLKSLDNIYDDIKLFDLQNIYSNYKIETQNIVQANGEKEESVDALKENMPNLEETNPPHQDIISNQEKTSIKKNVSSIRVSSLKIEELMNLVSELVTNQSSLELYAKNSGDSDLINSVENNQKLIRQLRDNALDISLIPINNLNTRFKRLIRDLSVELRKEIVFKTQGEDTELDKSVIDQLAEPLMHIFRNAIDHGIENDTKTRISKGKPKKGLIIMNSYYSGSDVIIEISDDGQGIDSQKIKNSALKKGLIDHRSNLTDNQLIDLIFEPGFSTAEKVSSISGRGVGMDVVKKKITDLQGTVRIESQLGKGTKFIVKIPLTLSIIDGILCSIDNFNYIIGIQHIRKIYKITKDEISASFNNMITLDDKQYPLINFRKEFKINSTPPPSQQVVLINQSDQMLGLLVDMVDKEVQVVVKPISGSSQQDELVSGAAIMGDGNIALVLNTNIILNQYTL